MDEWTYVDNINSFTFVERYKNTEMRGEHLSI